MKFLQNKCWLKCLAGVMAAAVLLCEILVMGAERYFFGLLVSFLEFGFDGLTLDVALALAIASTIASVGTTACLFCLLYRLLKK